MVGERTGSAYFGIENIYYPPEPPDEPPLVEPPENEPPLAPGLPQTGQLWWPVPILMAAGVFFVMMGCSRRN